jgi:UDP-2,4-diacetamido-2,4,6-trideoxy-beta-L-altropyranose hydrolase
VFKSRVVFRADGNNEIGLGHIIRSLALADMLNKHFHCVFAIQKPANKIQEIILKTCESLIILSRSNSYSEDLQELICNLQSKDIVVLDGYNFDTNYQETLLRKSYRIVSIDDLASFHFLSDIVINHADNIDSNKYSKSPLTKLCLGLNYLLLRKPFIDTAFIKREIFNVEDVFICFGGADFYNLTKKTLEACLVIDEIKNIHIVIGAAYENYDDLEKLVKSSSFSKKVVIKQNLTAESLVDEIIRCQLAIVPASGILYEVCSVGIGVLSGYYTDNQQNLLNGMINKNCIKSIGDFRQIKKLELSESIKEMLSLAKIRSQINSQKNIFNGLSPNIILKEFNKLALEQEVNCRKAIDSDAEQYFLWANDDLVRLNSINTQKLDYENHINWFKSKLLNKNSFLYYFEHEGRGLGQVRFDLFKGNYEIDYSVDALFRNKSFGSIILRIAIRECIKGRTNVSFVGKVKNTNHASQKIFESLNFSFFGQEQINGESYKLFKLNV